MSSILTKEPISENPSAFIYCEGNFGKIDGKTANGLVRNSETYKILAVIDSNLSGKDAGMVLEGKPNGIPIYGTLAEAWTKVERHPSHLIFGMAPATGFLSKENRHHIFEAIKLGMSIVNGLHEFLNEDPEFFSASIKYNIKLIDIRKPRPKTDLRLFSGQINKIECPRIAILGTDCAIGKRTTATILVGELKSRGIKAVLISTGQTGLIQGARYGVPLDAVPSQFCSGELEATIIEAYENEDPDAIVIEGQGALSHPAYSTSSFILRGSCPQGVILQDAPGRQYRCDFENMKMPSPASEINLIQTFSDTKVIGLTLNHENLSEEEVEEAVKQYQSELQIPVVDALVHPPKLLYEMIIKAFPILTIGRTDALS